HLPRYDQLQEEIGKADKDPKQKARAAELRKELERDKDLAALDTLIRIYSRPTVDTWRAYGIITIPPEVIESFLTIGQSNGARWGGEYEQSKDNMHLELLQLADPKSQGRPNGKG